MDAATLEQAKTTGAAAANARNPIVAAASAAAADPNAPMSYGEQMARVGGSILRGAGTVANGIFRTGPQALANALTPGAALPAPAPASPVAAVAPAAPAVPQISTPAPMAGAPAPAQLGTAGNIVVNGTDSQGKANSFSGTNVGSNAAYVTPAGAATMAGDSSGVGTGAAPAAGMPTPGATAGAVPPLALPNAPSTVGGPPVFGSGLNINGGSVNTNTGNIGAVAPVGADPGLHSNDDAVSAARQQAMFNIGKATDLLRTGDFNDAVRAKGLLNAAHIINDTTTASGSLLGSAARASQEALTTQRGQNTVANSTAYGHNVAANSTAYGHNVTASTAKYTADAELMLKMPAHDQAVALTQLSQRASQPGPAGDAARATLEAFHKANNPKGPIVLNGVAGQAIALADPQHLDNIRRLPTEAELNLSAPQKGKGAPVPQGEPLDKATILRRNDAQNAASGAPYRQQ